MMSASPQPLHDAESAKSQWRFGLGVAALFAATGLVYASIIPLQFQFRELGLAWQQFLDTPWLNLGISNRADWVANALVVLPIGFAATGSICFGHRLSVGRLAGILLVVAGTCLLVTAIEFLQIWFPPRTVSQNDIAAGFAGAFLGPLLWPLIGSPVLTSWLKLQDRGGLRAVVPLFCSWILAVYLLLMAAWSLLPGDFVLSLNELGLKWDAGRIKLIPGSELASEGSLHDFIKDLIGFAAAAAKMLPIGFIIFFTDLSRHRKIQIVFLTPVLLELLQIPVFSRHYSSSDIVMGWLGSGLGFLMASRTGLLQKINQNPKFRIAIVAIISCSVLASSLPGTERFANASELEARSQEFLQMPFVRYYYGSEFSAGSNLMIKFLAFVGLGAALANCVVSSGRSRSQPRQGKGICLLFAAALGLTFEVSQIFLIPHVPDASDAIVYFAGSACGFVIWSWLSSELSAPKNDAGVQKATSGQSPA